MATERLQDKRLQPYEAYFHLIDYKAIAQANWHSLLDKYLDMGKLHDEAKDRLGWIDRVNRIRNDVDHPGHPLDSQWIRYLTTINSSLEIRLKALHLDRALRPRPS
jgi:hypothetical protein